MNPARLALGAAAVALPFALGAFRPLARSGPSDVPVLRIEPQELVRRVPAQGNLRAVRATPINAPTGVRAPETITTSSKAFLQAD